MNWFITGTGTAVGKTYITALLLRSLRQAGIDSVGLKPICCGDRRDAEALQAAADNALSLDQVNPVWLPTPAAPYVAAGMANRPIDLDRIRTVFGQVRHAHQSVLVEGVGGWLVPIARNYSVADLAVELGLPVVIVAANVLGALNHTHLTARCVRASGAELAGVILNNLTGECDAATTTNRSVIEEVIGEPVLFEIAQGQEIVPVAIV